jgi:hypothetical protein
VENEALLTLAFLALPLVFVAMALFTAGYEHWLKHRLQHTGITTEAAIVELIRDVWRGTRNYYLSYEFKPAAGDTQLQRQSISQSHYDRLQTSPDRVVLVSYLPTNPDLARLTGEDEDFTVRNSALKRAGVLLVIWFVLLIVAVNQL